MPVRTSRAISAAYVGSQAKRRQHHLLQRAPTAGGKIGQMKTNRMISIPATTKFGTAMPTVAIDISEKSSTPPRRTAETMPAVKPSTNANAKCHNSQRRRNRQARGDHIVHRKIGHPEAQAEIDVQIIVQFDQVLLHQRQIEVVSLGVHLLDAVRWFAFAAKRPPGDRVHQKKRNREHRPQGADHPQQPSQQKPNHPRPPALRNLCFSSSSIQIVFERMHVEQIRIPAFHIRPHHVRRDAVIDRNDRQFVEQNRFGLFQNLHPLRRDRFRGGFGNQFVVLFVRPAGLIVGVVGRPHIEKRVGVEIIANPASATKPGIATSVWAAR